MDKFTFYFDRNFGRRFPESLAHIDPPFDVQHHHGSTTRFSANTPDDQWLSVVGSRGWIVFSHDRRFHSDGPSAIAIRQHGIACFYLWGGEATSWNKLRTFTRAYDNIVKAIDETVRPYIFDVSRTGQIARVELN